MGAGAVHHVVVVAGEVAAAGSLHLDHPGAQIGQVPGRQRSRDGLLDGNDGDALERKRHNVHYSPGDQDQSKPTAYIGTLMPRLTSQTLAGQDIADPAIMPTCIRATC